MTPNELKKKTIQASILAKLVWEEVDFTCSGCKRVSRARKWFDITEVPLILVVNLAVFVRFALLFCVLTL